MFDRLEVFQTAFAFARHAADRQVLTARNIANADSPGYQAQRLPDFSDVFDRSTMRTAAQSGDRISSISFIDDHAYSDTRSLSPNGNSVSIEQEMLHGVQAERSHRRAMTIYKHSLDVMRGVLGRR